jgi:hypothetical protein
MEKEMGKPRLRLSQKKIKKNPKICDESLDLRFVKVHNSPPSLRLFPPPSPFLAM